MSSSDQEDHDEDAPLVRDPAASSSSSSSSRHPSRPSASSSAVGEVPVSQSLIKAASNVCFSFFVLAVLAVTVVAVTYQPPDPWLQSSAAITTSLSRVLPNSSFLLPDDSLLPTGEDFASPSPSAAPDAADQAAAAPGGSNATATAGTCDPDAPLNCTDPRVLAAVKAFNAKAFFRKSIVFLSYEAPVPGPKPGQCDVAWRFRNRREKSWRRYRDYRRFELTPGDGCALDITKVGKFRSGKNAARPPRPKGPKRPRVAAPPVDAEINDTIPLVGSEAEFRRGKALKSRDTSSATPGVTPAPRPGPARIGIWKWQLIPDTAIEGLWYAARGPVAGEHSRNHAAHHVVKTGCTVALPPLSEARP